MWKDGFLPVIAAVLAVALLLTGCVDQGAAPRLPTSTTQPGEAGGGQPGGSQAGGTPPLQPGAPAQGGPGTPAAPPAEPPASQARVEFKEIHSYEVSGEIWTLNLRQTMSPDGRWALATQTDATGVQMVALPLDAAAGKEARVLHSADRNWTSNHLFGYYPLGWVSDTRCLFAIQGWQNTGPHKGKRGVAILVGDVGVEPATAEEVAFISLSEGLLNSGLMVPGRGKAYLHTPKVIWEYDTATSKIRQVKGDLPNYEGLFFPRPSPDGRYYVYDLREKSAHGVYLLDTETGQQSPLLPTGETMSFYPAWSPDGKYIAAYTVNKKKVADTDAQTDQGVLWTNYDLLEGEDGPQSVGDRITVVDLSGKIVQTIEVEGQKVGTFRWGPSSNAIGFLAGTIKTGDGGLRQLEADSVWLVSSGDALAEGVTASPLKVATIRADSPEKTVYALTWGVDIDGGGVLYNEYRQDRILIRHARLDSPGSEPDMIEGAFADWGMEYLGQAPMVSAVEGGQWSAVWAFEPTGIREVVRFGPNRHTMVLGYSGEVLAVANSPFWMPDMAKPGAKVEKAVIKVYRIVKT